MAVGTPRVVAIVQARMGSARLPGKVLADIEGKPMLERVIQRLQQCKRIHSIVVATSQDESDDPIVAVVLRNWANHYGHPGDPNDVLGRYVGAARLNKADIVVRVTADCPLIDPGTVDQTVKALLEDNLADYAANVIERTYPDGLDVEALWFDTLLRLDRYAERHEDREHVTRYLLRAGEPFFSAYSITTSPDRSDWRWTVDTEADLEYVRLLYRRLGLAERRDMPYEELAAQISIGLAPLRLARDEPRRTLEAA